MGHFPLPHVGIDDHPSRSFLVCDHHHHFVSQKIKAQRGQGIIEKDAGGSVMV